jgi:hypothetical protein
MCRTFLCDAFFYLLISQMNRLLLYLTPSVILFLYAKYQLCPLTSHTKPYSSLSANMLAIVLPP